jgi:hypothetical protein
MSHEEALALSPQEVKQHIYGSKMTLVVEMLTLATTVSKVMGKTLRMLRHLPTILHITFSGHAKDASA